MLGHKNAKNDEICLHSFSNRFGVNIVGVNLGGRSIWGVIRLFK